MNCYLRQLLQTLTGVFQPRTGTGLRLGEQSSHTPFPHSRQWWSGIRGPNGSWQHTQTLHSLSGVQYAGLAVSFIMPLGISKTEATFEKEFTTTSPYFRALTSPSSWLCDRLGGFSWKHELQTLTSSYQPRLGTGWYFDEQPSQKPSPHARQWCFLAEELNEVLQR